MRKKKQKSTDTGVETGTFTQAIGQRRVGATVNGSVQGVGFRYFTQFTAGRFGITGWVRNASDGSVEFEAQGLSDDVDAFLVRIADGPPLSYVSEVKSYEMPVVEGEKRFEIRY